MRALLSVDESALIRIMKVCVIDLLRVGIGECSIKYVVRFVSGLSGLYTVRLVLSTSAVSALLRFYKSTVILVVGDEWSD